MDINDVRIGQAVTIPGSGEEGTVARIDYDDYEIFVDVPFAGGLDRIDLTPEEIEPKVVT